MGFMSPPKPPGPDPELQSSAKLSKLVWMKKRNKMSVVLDMERRSEQTFMALDPCR